jgi:pyruvate dehydrogenase E1 component alpha subunit
VWAKLKVKSLKDMQKEPHFFPDHKEKLLKELGKERLVESLRKMLCIRNFEIRSESAYQHGYIGGFFHAYTGQEAIQTSCVDLLGQAPWYLTTYRCHALALLLGVTPKEAMAELYGKVTGNAKGRGGSMHLYADRLLGGFGIVGGHVPLAIGAAFSLKYQKKKSLAVCFLGDGAVVQGAVHESLNLASLWDLPCIFVIENNKWGMGTAVERAVSLSPIAESLAPPYGLKGYSVDGMNYFSCYSCFKAASEEVLETNRPVIIEAFTERFKGHSISDPGLYRSKECLKKILENDPIIYLFQVLQEAGYLTQDEYERINKEEKDKAIEAMKFAEESPYPDVMTLEEGVMYPWKS